MLRVVEVWVVVVGTGVGGCCWRWSVGIKIVREVVGLGAVLLVVLGCVVVLAVGHTNITRNQTMPQHIRGIPFTLTSFCPQWAVLISIYTCSGSGVGAVVVIVVGGGSYEL